MKHRVCPYRTVPLMNVPVNIRAQSVDARAKGVKGVAEEIPFEWEMIDVSSTDAKANRSGSNMIFKSLKDNWLQEF